MNMCLIHFLLMGRGNIIKAPYTRKYFTMGWLTGSDGESMTIMVCGGVCGQVGRQGTRAVTRKYRTDFHVGGRESKTGSV